MGARFAPTWLVAVALLGAPAGAQAAPEPAARTSSLAWVRSDGADGCIGNKELAESVERILGRRVFVSASAGDVAVEGHVDRVAGGWKATLRISDEHGTLLGSRELASEASDCRAMDASIAFVIAVMIDPDAAERPRPPVAPPSPAPAPMPATPPAPPAAPSTTPNPAPAPAGAPSRWTIAPEIGPTVAFGELPSAAWGATLAVRFGPPAFGVELLGSTFAPQTVAVPGVPGASGHFTWAYAGAALCPALARSRAVSLVACAGAAGGVLTATPRGLANEEGSTNFDALAILRARVEWRVTSAFFVVGRGGADVPFERPAWTATSSAGASITVFRPSAVAGEAGLAAGITFD
jgi:hypothetical protein